MDRNAAAVDGPAGFVGTAPIRPGWVDALQAWVARLPGPTWAPYAVAWLALAATETAFKWADGTYPVGTLFPYHVVAFGTAAYGLAWLHDLDRSADRALNALRPALQLDDAAVGHLRERLVHLPAGPTLIATLLGMAFGAAQRTWIVGPQIDVLRYATHGAVAAFEFVVVPLFTWAVIAIAAYAGIRQVRAIDAIYRRCAAVDLFDVGTLYAFTGHAARMALGLLAIGCLWLLAYPREVTGDAVGLFGGTLAALTAFAIVVFLAPLWAAHQRLVVEKRRRTAAAHRRLQGVLAEQHRRLDAGAYADVDATAKSIAALTSELALLDRASTWPWPASTLRGFLTAVLLPLFLFSAQQLLRAALGL